MTDHHEPLTDAPAVAVPYRIDQLSLALSLGGQRRWWGRCGG